VSPIDRFTCEETFRRLDLYVDRELSAEEMALVRQHLEVCAVCAGEYAFEEGVLGGIRERLQRIDVAPSLLEKVREAVARAERDVRSS
jgi:anti-sigma factor RsiW